MGAKAPTPGVGRRIAISEELKVAEEEWVRVRCGRDGKDVTLRHSSIGPEDERMCEAQAGVNLWRALADPSSVTNIAVIYWAARRKNGERKLAFADVVKSFPNVQAVVDAGLRRAVVGSAAEAADQLRSLAEQFSVDEVMVHPIASAYRGVDPATAPAREVTLELLAKELF